MDWAIFISITSTIILTVLNVRSNQKIEALKGEIEQKLFTHKLQFETEFNVYKEVWASLVELKIEVQSLRPVMDMSEEGKSYYETIVSRATKVNESGRQAIRLIQRSEPFYPSGVYTKLVKVITLLNELVISSIPFADDSNSAKYWTEREGQLKIINKAIDDVGAEIRKRVGTI